MFKKPKRKIRGRRTQRSDSEDDDKEKTGDSIVLDHEVDQTKNESVNTIKTRVKFKENSTKSSVLSFGDDEEEETADIEIFKIKKSSHSRRIAKQLKKETRKEREEREKRENEEREGKAAAEGGSAQRDREDSSDSIDSDPVNGTPPDFNLRSESDEEENKGPFSRPFHSILQSGMIPDANIIHLARKRRQQAREMGDFIPLDDTVNKVEENKSRLIREDENDLSDEGEEDRLSFSVNHREQHLRKIQTTILAAEEDNENSDHEREWEEQQIRKAVNVPLVRSTNGNSQKGEQLYDNYQQYLYNQGSNIFNPNGSTMLNQSQTPGSLDAKLVLQPEGKPVNIKILKKNLKDRLDNMISVHRTHRLERDDIESRLELCECDIDKNSGSRGDLEERYKFFQEMRGYVRDLVECLNEKVPQIDYLDRCLMSILKQRSERLIKRRQEDIKDQSSEFSAGKAAMAPNLMDPNLGQDTEKQRRVAEREARRSRRRRAREAKGIRDHQEGCSTDEEERNSDMSRFQAEKNRIILDSRTIFDDVVEDFSQVRCIKSRFEAWKFGQSESYEEAYIGLCLPKLITPYLKLRLIEWNPLEVDCPNFEETGWYESLMFYAYSEGQEPQVDDPDTKLMPSLIEKVLLPKLSALVEGVWDPMSTGQTARLGRVARKLVQDYPTITADSKNTQAFFRAVANRLRKTLDDDVFMPLYPKAVLESRTQGPYQFFQRQFWGCIKLLGNMLQWHGLLSDALLRELGLDGLLNRYMVLALMNSPINSESILKCQVITSTFPKSWFSQLQGDSTIPQLQNLVRYLVYAAEQIQQMQPNVKETKDSLKQIIKMLVNIHAMDHALVLGTKFSVRMSGM